MVAEMRNQNNSEGGWAQLGQPGVKMYTYSSPGPMESFLVDTDFYQSMLHTMYFGKLKECGLSGGKYTAKPLYREGEKLIGR